MGGRVRDLAHPLVRTRLADVRQVSGGDHQRGLRDRLRRVGEDRREPVVGFVGDEPPNPGRVLEVREALEWGRDTDVACREGTLSEHGAGLAAASDGVNLPEDARVTVRVGRVLIEVTSSGQPPRAYALGVAQDMADRAKEPVGRRTPPRRPVPHRAPHGLPLPPARRPPLWATALRQENERRAQRLFNLPDDWDLPDTGRPRPDRPGTVSTGGVRFTR
ncbi:hypothetical protein ABT126_26275 [Streptomyces sp. NPDC002012]|uniref:hypothetical protein n=1 Tax=Streptomyces sp. NPDC002012 TaxID=3154532 RepID=UPI003329CF35